MVIVLKNRAAIYQREAAEMLHNISLYPGLTEDQLCRFFPEKEATAKTLLAHMLKGGRIFCAGNDRYYANREVQSNAVKDLSRCVWVLLDFIDQVEYHTVGEFPAAMLLLRSVWPMIPGRCVILSRRLGLDIRPLL